MTMCVGFITYKNVYLATDSRWSYDIDFVGSRRYDYGRKIIYLNENEKLWATSAGLRPALDFVYQTFEKKKIDTIDILYDIQPSFFEEQHRLALSEYNLSLEDSKYESSDYMNLIFAGIDKEGKPKLCFVDSGDEYRLQWFDKPGDFVYNRVFNAEMDKDLRENMERISQEALKNDDIGHVVKLLKPFFKYVSEGETSGVISPLKDVLKITKDGIEVRELRKVRQCIDDLRYRVESFLFYKILHLHKLSPHAKKI